MEQLGQADLERRRRARQIAIVLAAVRNRLAHEVTGMVAVADADCSVLLSDGDRDACRRAAAAGLESGGLWSLTSAGSNGIGLAAMFRKPCQIFSDEHWKAEQRNLVCAVRPIFSGGDLVAIVNVEPLPQAGYWLIRQVPEGEPIRVILDASEPGQFWVRVRGTVEPWIAWSPATGTLRFSGCYTGIAPD